MSVLVTLYSIVSHAYSVSGFSIQDSVLSRFPIFCANSHLQGYGRSLGKDTKSFEWLHSLPQKEKKPNDVAPIYYRPVYLYFRTAPREHWLI